MNNSLKTNSKNNFVKKLDFKKILIGLVILLVLIIFFYLIFFIYKFNKTSCFKKKTLSEYLSGFSYNDVCLMERAPPVPVKPKPEPKKESIIDMLPKLEKKEVYHIANQDYTYNQGKCKCESYGGELASKSQIVDAYNNGANWCSYGWTEGQSAYYPVQKCEWDKIQAINERLPKNQKKYCGDPGINGGFFPNPLIKFGVNCYGVKPKGEVNKPKVPYCPPQNFCELPRNYQASHKLDTDEITPFNENQWNMNM